MCPSRCFYSPQSSIGPTFSPSSWKLPSMAIHILNQSQGSLIQPFLSSPFPPKGSFVNLQALFVHLYTPPRVTKEEHWSRATKALSPFCANYLTLAITVAHLFPKQLPFLLHTGKAVLNQRQKYILNEEFKKKIPLWAMENAPSDFSLIVLGVEMNNVQWYQFNLFLIPASPLPMNQATSLPRGHVPRNQREATLSCLHEKETPFAAKSHLDASALAAAAKQTSSVRKVSIQVRGQN